MMEGVHYEIDTEAQFWGELDEIVSPVGSPHTEISVESVVRNYVRFAALFQSTVHNS